jgi:hypothetical protein
MENNRDESRQSTVDGVVLASIILHGDCEPGFLMAIAANNRRERRDEEANEGESQKRQGFGQEGVGQGVAVSKSQAAD